MQGLNAFTGKGNPREIGPSLNANPNKRIIIKTIILLIVRPVNLSLGQKPNISERYGRSCEGKIQGILKNSLAEMKEIGLPGVKCSSSGNRHEDAG